MPEVEVWQGFFDPAHILDRLDCDKPGNVVEFGCGYGLFTVEAAKRSTGTVYALDIEPEMLAATTEAARKAGVANVQPMERDFVADGTGLPSQSCGISTNRWRCSAKHPVSCSPAASWESSTGTSIPQRQEARRWTYGRRLSSVADGPRKPGSASFVRSRESRGGTGDY
jgi:SAM-dependent methyltransferase